MTELSGDTIVHITQGTMAFKPTEQLRLKKRKQRFHMDFFLGEPMAVSVRQESVFFLTQGITLRFTYSSVGPTGGSI